MCIMIDSRGVKRFLKYAVVGGTTFGIDLALIWVLTEIIHIPYYVSIPLGFWIAVSLNYFLARRFVFIGTERSMHKGYFFFLIPAVAGAFLITGAVALMVTYAGMHYLVARVLVACVGGALNYLVNLHFNFKVAGKEH